jgi:hypothetical protein
MASPESVVANPEWLALRFDDARNQLHFVRVSREGHRQAVFLTEEYLADTDERQVVARDDIRPVGEDRAPLHFIFHSGFCCSTLLTRAFDLPGTAMGLKEPQILLDITGYELRGAQESALDRAIMEMLHLLARPFEQGEAVIVKPSCLANGQAGRIMRLRPNAHALFLYAPPRVFLGSIARKGITGRLWARELFAGLQKTGLTELGYSQEELFRQTDLQIAGLTWLAQQIFFSRLARELGPNRLRMIDSETLLAHPEDTIRALGAHFGLNLSADEVATIMNGPAFREHSKFGTDFSASERERVRAEAEDLYADEIEKVAMWLEKVAEGLGIGFDPVNPLLD